ncbi:MAG: sodium:proton antiporter [Deltaproteobacteria bacterium]|nr:sodium:proton antiporter [Deltaproteobacteria bacterium]
MALTGGEAPCHTGPSMTAPEEAAPIGQWLPAWSIAPFVMMLLAIAVLPLVAPRWWEKDRHKGLVALGLGLPTGVALALFDHGAVLHAAHEYVAFIVLLMTLFVISGGIVVRGKLAGSPEVNVLLLAIGAVLASLIGTTGASMVLIRPLLRANRARQRQAHVVVFFIFVVSNIGGLLTPVGDPPLFLGFLRGVPFFWTLHLLPEWAAVVLLLLAVFYVVDTVIFRREDVRTPGDLDEQVRVDREPLSVAGKRNLAYLFGVVGVVVVCGHFKPAAGVQEAGMLLFLGLSLATTPRALHDENGFGWGPIIEVAVIFAGIFVTMIPALAILGARGATLGLAEPWQFFWAAGALSSFLDNAPTYLVFTAIASGLCGTDANTLAELVGHERGALLLSAISLGSVMMGANTYIGNGPNFMVKAVAESAGVKMPSFFGYMAYSGAILVPTFVAVTWLFLL